MGGRFVLQNSSVGGEEIFRKGVSFGGSFSVAYEIIHLAHRKLIYVEWFPISKIAKRLNSKSR